MLASFAASSRRVRRTEVRRACAAALLIWSGAALAAPQFRLLDVWVNGQSMDASAIIVEDGGRFYAPASALAQWRLKPTDEIRMIEGMPHHALQAWRPRLHADTQRLELSAGAEAFDGQVLRLGSTGQPGTSVVLDTSPGLALDYTLNMDREWGRSQSSAYLDLRAFGLLPDSAFRHSGILRAGALPPGEARWRRLDSSWRHADMDRQWRTQVGDTLSCGGELAPTLRYAGVQMQNDPGMQPDEARHPLPSVQGSAQVPSGVDLLINDRPAGSLSVGSGPFSLESLPTVTGAGEIRIIQRDLQGIEQVRTLPYYTSPRLLRAGLSDQCVEAGVLRLNYGLPSDRYDGRFAAASWRQGWTDTVTALARVEAGDSVRSLRMGAHWVPAQMGVLSVQTAWSQSDGGGAGQSMRLGMERITLRYHLSASLEHASDGFRQTDGTRSPLRRATLFGGWMFGATSWSAGGVWQTSANGQRVRVFTTSLQRRVGEDWQMGLSALQRESRWSAALMLTRQLERDIALATRLQAGDNAGLAVQAQRYEPVAGGAGWRVQGGTGQTRALGAWSWLGEHGRLELQAAQLAHADDPALRATYTGGMIWLGGAPVLGRALGDSVAAQIEVEGMPGVGVQLNRREVAVTDAQGRAWIHGLQPWEENVIGISPDALPMDMLVNVPEIQLRPRADAVVKARFPARRTRSALVVVQRNGGEPIAAGSRAQRERDLPGEGAPFARGGQVYLNDLEDHNQLRIEGPHGVCHVSFTAPPASALQPRIGPFTCQAEAS
jgi:outer membrane usher protein